VVAVDGVSLKGQAPCRNHRHQHGDRGKGEEEKTMKGFTEFYIYFGRTYSFRRPPWRVTECEMALLKREGPK